MTRRPPSSSSRASSRSSQGVQGELRACQEAITEQDAQRNALGVQRK